ncbi:hypothetical protein SynM161_01744 [Synechococcus sp. M16.1]|nr:hypothetical protein SynM161_01744 [Synechococcus sp. M16.1]
MNVKIIIFRMKKGCLIEAAQANSCPEIIAFLFCSLFSQSLYG